MMTVRTTIRWLIALVIASVIALVLAARANWAAGILLVPGLFVAGATLAAVLTNRPYWRKPQQQASPEAAVIATRRNARVMALTYAWGALSLQALYTPPLTGYLWLPGWPAAMVLACVALGTSLLGYFLVGRSDPARKARQQRRIGWWLVVQGVLAGAVVVGMAAAAPDDSRHAAWGGVHLILFCALAIEFQSVFALRTQTHLGA